MVGVALPLALALAVSLGEAAQTAAWRGLLDDPQTGPALRASLVSGLGSTLIATALSLWLTTCLWAHPRWTALQRRLPAMLAVPHAALAIGLLLLWMPGGWIARLLAPLAGWDVPPDWTTVNDPHALALTLALVLKETPFLLWTIAALLARPDVAPRLRQQLALGRSLGYTPAQVWWRVVWPGGGGALVWPVAISSVPAWSRCVSGTPSAAAAPCAALMPGTVSQAMPAAIKASASSPPRPKM